jgi:hypothetical protein
MNCKIFIFFILIIPAVAPGQGLDNKIDSSFEDPVVIINPNYFDTSEYLSHRAIFGLGVGSPAFFNFIVGYNWKSFGIRLSAGSLFSLIGSGNFWGVQGNLSHVFYRKKKFLIDISLVGMSVTGVSGTLQQVGISCSMNLRGFFVELGYPYRLDKNNTQFEWRPLLQIGYVH